MNTSTEQVFVVNSIENQPPLQRGFAIAMPAEALETEDVQDPSNLCDLPQSNIPSTNMESRSHMCRLCATITEFVVPIFEGEGLQNRLADKIHQHLPIQVSQEDILPTVMCFQCTSTLLAWHELVMCSVQADSAMRERYNLHLSQKKEEKPNISTNQGDTIHEKSEGNAVESPRANVPCEFCSRDVSDSDLRLHLLAAHADRLFLCAECNVYRNKETMMVHMGKHIEPDENEEESEKIESKPAPKIVIPVVRIQRIPSKLPPLPKTDVPPPPHVPAPAPIPNKISSSPPIVHNLNSSKDLKLESAKPVLLLLRAAESVELNQKQNIAPPSYSESIRASERTNANTKTDSPPRSEPADMEPFQQETHRKDNAEDESPKRDFSDHSDIENEFGRIPASVFDAIEDTEDGNSNEGSPEPPSRPTESPKNKSKKQPQSRPCPVCGKTYTSLSSWYYHMKHAHVKDKKLACDRCNKAFVSKERLSIHKRTHATEKPFVCKVCGKGFTAAAGRYIHERTHTEKKEYPCTQCDRAFPWSAQLKRHEARHAKKQEFVCNVCGRGFSVGFDLLRHARRHAPECHECDICGSKFKQKRYLKVHMENKHIGQTARVAAAVESV